MEVKEEDTNLYIKRRQCALKALIIQRAAVLKRVRECYTKTQVATTQPQSFTITINIYSIFNTARQIATVFIFNLHPIAVCLFLLELAY